MTTDRFPWKVALTVGGVALSALGLVRLFSRETQPLGRVALIGDSYAVGLGPELAKILPGLQYEGHIGTSTWQWANRKSCGQCGDWLPAFKPQIVLVSLGVNDGTAPDRANYQTIVQRIHGLGARVIWIEPPARIPTPSRGVISALGVQTVPATTTPLAADRLHPASYGPWAQEIARTLT